MCILICMPVCTDAETMHMLEVDIEGLPHALFTFYTEVESLT